MIPERWKFWKRKPAHQPFKQPPLASSRRLNLRRALLERQFPSKTRGATKTQTRRLLKAILREPYFKDFVFKLEHRANLAAGHDQAISREAALKVAQDVLGSLHNNVVRASMLDNAFASRLAEGISRNPRPLSEIIGRIGLPQEQKEYFDSLRNKRIVVKFGSGSCEISVRKH